MAARITSDVTVMMVSRVYERRLIVVASVLTLIFLATFRIAMHYVSGDMIWFYVPWYQHIIRYGRIVSLEGSYSNYSPPYLYILSLFTWLDGYFSPVNIIKLASVPFLVASAALFWSICRAAGCSERVAWLAAWIALVIPESTPTPLRLGNAIYKAPHSFYSLYA